MIKLRKGGTKTLKGPLSFKGELAGVDTTGVSSAEMVWLASLEDVGVSA